MRLINVDPVLNIEEESETPTGTIALRYAILSHRCKGEEDLKIPQEQTSIPLWPRRHLQSGSERKYKVGLD